MSEAFSGEANPTWNQTAVNCSFCGVEKSVPKSRLDAIDHHFCDKDCYAEWQKENVHGENHPHWEGGVVDYGPGWDEHKREQIRERDGRTCQHPGCGMTGSEHRDQFGERLHVHHIMKARQFDDPDKRNSGENLITLCRVHHDEWERLSPLRPVEA